MPTEEPQRVILALRFASGMTQRALAAKAGLSARSLCFIELGKRPPRVATKAAIARALGVAPDDIFGPAAIQPEQRAMRAIRWASRMTQKQLADKAGLSAATIQSIEKGRHRPKARTKAAIAQALDVETEDVFPPATAPLVDPELARA